METPISVVINERIKIYDVLHNDENQLVIIMPSSRRLGIYKVDGENKKKFTFHQCGHGHTYVYILEEETKYEENIKLLIDNVSIETRVKKYKCYEDKILMSTMVYNEDNYIRQWIKFHKNMGVDKFIIYDNSTNYDNQSHHSKENKSNLKELLKDLIKEGIVLLINWPYPKRESKVKISGQACQQNHSINAFKKSKYIGLFDIDEYINIQNECGDINSFIDGIIKEEKIEELGNVGGFSFKNKFFYNPHRKSEEGYEFLKIFDCGPLINSIKDRCKNLIIPKNVITHCVHEITKGKKVYGVSKEKAYFNHYFYLNKEGRGKDNNGKTDDSIMKHTKGLF